MPAPQARSAPVNRFAAGWNYVSPQSEAMHRLPFANTIEHDGINLGNGDRLILPQREARTIPVASAAC